MRRDLMLLALVAAGCGSSTTQQRFLIQQEFIDANSGETFLGHGCTPVGGNQGPGNGPGGAGFGGGGPNGSFSIQTMDEGDGVRLIVTGGAGQQVVRDYSMDFLASGKVDEFAVSIGTNSFLRLYNWGATACPSSDGGPPGR